MILISGSELLKETDSGIYALGALIEFLGPDRPVVPKGAASAVGGLGTLKSSGCPVVLFHKGLSCVCESVLCVCCPYVSRKSKDFRGKLIEVQIQV